MAEIRKCSDTKVILNNQYAFRNCLTDELYSVDSPHAEHLSAFEDSYVYDLSDEEFLLDDDYSDLDWYDYVFITAEGEII